ncbi:MAG: BON domain-containing protein [Chloroflexi bacterium]|nr:BON domain-containing protein [Chloroflexota bacterium]
MARGADLSDSVLIEGVERSLATDPAIPLLDIDVRAVHGAVYLEGRVMTLAQVALAKELALRVEGVREVVSRLSIGEVVDNPEDQGYDDTTISNEIDVLLPANISIRDNATEVIGGKVFLRGLVFSADDRERAERLAATVRGVQEVRNELVVGSEEFDEAIAAEVAFALRESPRVHEDKVVVTSAEGIVYLTGEVKTSREREAAGQITRGIEGVSRIINRLAVNPILGWTEGDLEFLETDPKMGQAVLDSLAKDGRLRAANVEIRPYYRKGTLLLAGVANALREKKLAETIALKTEGVERVINRLEIDATPVRTDEQITEHVWDALAEDTAICPSPLSFVVRDGVVTISGQMESLQRMRLLTATLWWIPGIRDVEVDLEILHPEEDSDGLITDAVKAVLYKDSLVDATAVLVRTAGGVVMLSGAVGNFAEKDLAEDDAWAVPGVRDVINELTVVPR